MTTIDPREVRIHMSRGGALGACPSYAITVSGTGQVEYEGYAHVDQKGWHNFEIPQQRILPILDLLFRLRFFDFHGDALNTVALSADSQYLITRMHNPTDHSILTVTVDFGPFHNTVNSERLGFPSLEAIGTSIEQAVKIEELIGKNE